MRFNSTLINLLSSVLFDLPMPLVEPSLWAELLAEAKTGGCMALLYDAIMRMPQDKQPSGKVAIELAAHVSQVERHNQRCADATELLLQRLGVPCGEVVKGARIARLYPCNAHREQHDVDLFTGNHTAQLVDRLRALGVSVDTANPRHATFTCRGISIEAHAYLMYNARDNAIIDAAIESSADHKLSEYAHALFVCAHIEYHATFFDRPIPLQHLIDWLLITTNQAFDYTQFCAIKRGSSVERFADLLTAYCFDLFSQGHMPVEVAENGLVWLLLPKFETLYMRPQQRRSNSIVRALARATHYIRYRSAYRSIYGQGMMQRFYWRNLSIALSQKLTGKA